VRLNLTDFGKTMTDLDKQEPAGNNLQNLSPKTPMWKRLLKPELALSFWGIFECVIMPESDWGCYYIGVGDEADDHVNEWLSE